MKKEDSHKKRILCLAVVVCLLTSGNASAEFVFGEVVNLGPNVNSSSCEYGLSISADGLSLFFDSDRPNMGTYDIYVATRETIDDDWGLAVSVGPAINIGMSQACPSISTDGLELFLSSPDWQSNWTLFGGADLWVSRRSSVSEPWSVPENLEAEINTSNHDTEPSISADGLSLYFASDRPGGHSAFDIWVTTRKTRDESWEEPTNLGPTVNLEAAWAPSISGSDLALFFVSDRAGGHGLFDLWVTTRATRDDPWGPPVNLGPTINTSAYDLVPCISRDGSILYFSSGRSPKSGCFDIFEAPILSSDIDLRWSEMKCFPPNRATDVPRDVMLNWTAGTLAETYDVYFGTVFDDVQSGDSTSLPGMLVSEGQDACSFDPVGLLEFNQTYYWRVDEVNTSPDSSVVKGYVWSFTVEPFSYAVPTASIVATASNAAEGQDPANVINGAGLNEADQHSTQREAMWLADGVEPTASVQFDFEKIQKLDKVHVWNHNTQSESVLGFGVKEALIEHSTDGATWTEFSTLEMAQAPGKADYSGFDIALNSILAKHIKLTALSNWSLLGLQETGLSEIRFCSIPVRARNPVPASGSITDSVDVTLEWRAGRDAISHEIYLSTDRQAVVDGTALITTETERRYAPGSLEGGQTYYWKVNEVNEADAIRVWEGDVWEFNTVD